VSAVVEAVAALRAGGLVVIPTDTVYGLACAADREDAARALSRLKGRGETQPLAVVAASVDALVELVPELAGRSEAIARALLPGALTLVLPNPARRLPWLAGSSPETIGIRVPGLDASTREVVEAAGPVAATSANVHGGADPRSLADVPAEILVGVDAVLDGGELPGVASTVVDVSGSQPRVLREGAVPAEQALAAVESVVGQ
jgi:L-threonylcarbamoyladenylate synthase